MRVIVTKENQDEYPVPIGTVVKWTRWRRWADPMTLESCIRYEIRCTEVPLPENLRNVSISPDDRSFFQVLPLADDGTEGVPLVIPYCTFWLETPTSTLRPKLEGANNYAQV
jgi:hypothetical protein